MRRRKSVLDELYEAMQSDRAESLRSCNCIGPQNGLPVCPCAMLRVVVENGRYVEKIDHGPVQPITEPDSAPTPP